MIRVDLPHPLLVEFDSNRVADWQERGSDVCLYFVRAAFGSMCDERMRLSEYTNSVALKALAGLMAFTLWLPITFIGILLHYCSKTHEVAYLFAKSQGEQKPQPLNTVVATVHSTATALVKKLPEPCSPPTTTSITVISQQPTVVPPTVKATLTQPFVEKPPKPLSTHAVTSVAIPSQKAPKEQLEEFLKTYNVAEENAEAISKLMSALSIEELEYFMGDLNAHLDKYPANIQSLLLATVLNQINRHLGQEKVKKLDAQLLQRYSNMSNEEYARYLPLFEKTTIAYHYFSKLEECWKPERSRAIGRLVMRQMKPNCPDFWRTWEHLWEGYGLSIQMQSQLENRNATEAALLAVQGERDYKMQLMLQDAVAICCGHPYLLARLYETVQKNVSLLIKLFSRDQLAMVTRGLQEIYAERKEDLAALAQHFLELTERIIQAEPIGSLQQRIDRVTVVATTLGKHPIYWLMEKKEKYIPLMEYILFYEVQRVLKNADEKSRSEQVQSIALALGTWVEFVENYPFSPDVPQALAELAVAAEGEGSFSIILDALAQSLEGNIKSQAAIGVEQRKLNFLSNLFLKFLPVLGAPQRVSASNEVIAGRINRITHMRVSQNSKRYSLGRQYEGLEFQVGSIMNRMMKLPVSSQKLEAALVHYLEYRHFRYAHNKLKQCFIELISKISSLEILDAVINAILTAGFPADVLKKMLQERDLPSGTLNMSSNFQLTSEQVAERIQARINAMQDPVNSVLKAAGLPPELRNIVLDYFIAVQRPALKTEGT